MTTYNLRKNASQKSIDTTIEQIKKDWHYADKNGAVLFQENGVDVLKTPGIYFLALGGVTRYGFKNDFEAWGFDENHVCREIAGMEEYAYSRQEA